MKIASEKGAQVFKLKKNITEIWLFLSTKNLNTYFIKGINVLYYT